jgi:hypothetical protein
MNSTTLTTVLGIGQSIGVAVIDYITHSPMEGGVMKQPTFWIGLVVAALMGVKAYYTQGTPATPAVEEAPKV